MSYRITIKSAVAMLVLAAISCSFLTQRILSPSTASTPSPTVDQEISVIVSASQGGEVALPDNTILRIPAGSLLSDTEISLHKITANDFPSIQEEFSTVGSVYHIDLGTESLKEPATLEIPYDLTLLPAGIEPSQVFLSYYDEDKREWVYAGGEVDINRNVVILPTYHASWWMPTTWNWGAWIAILDKILRVSVANWIEAVKLLTDDCPQIGEHVRVDSSLARNLVQGCVERDDFELPELRVVNPKAFFFEIRPIAGGNAYPSPTILSPGEDLNFEASTSDPSPLIIEARMTQKTGWYLIVHMVLTMLPGANQFGIQGHHVACITERLADVSYFASAVESLLVDHDGAAAAEHLFRFLNNSDAVRRFITAADDCNFGPARTWSIEGIRQIGGAVSTIMSATDYIANYFDGNDRAQVSFVWAETVLPDTTSGSQTPANFGPEAIWESEDFFKFQDCLFQSSSVIDCVVSVMQTSGASPQAIEFTRLFEGNAFMQSFEEYGVVDLAAIAYPSRANDNFQYILVNGTPQIVHVEDVWSIDIQQDPNYPALVKQYPNLTVWGGGNSFIRMEQLPEGGQRFIFSYILVNLCHACLTGHSAVIAFDFDNTGKFLGITLLYLE